MTTPRYILDLDGTLMPSHAVDNRCYWAAVHEVFGTAGGTVKLTKFRHVTDSGILREWAEQELERLPTRDEVETVRDVFLARIESAAQDEPDAFRPLPGVEDWLADQPQDHLAIATGGWEHTARFKLRAAGLGGFELPLATSDQAETRTGIMRHALSLLPTARGAPTVYIGDGPWDVAAARELGWSFIGIAAGSRARDLVAAGAERVHADFRALAPG
jgi:phosphoglycolate phosphatase-like HAD superfamily hydrolase